MITVRPFVLGIAGLTLSPDEIALFKNDPPAGIILFLRNVENPFQLRALIDQIKSLSNGQTLIYVDQEGGRVQRLLPPHWKQYPIAAEFDHLDGQEFKDAIYKNYRSIGDDLAAVGIDINCAPCLDLRHDLTADFLKTRSFGSDKSRVISAGQACMSGLRDSGIIPVIKHIPGHGRATVDSHLTMPEVVFERDPLGTTLPDDIEIFSAFRDAEMAMSSHILFPQIDDQQPLTLSSKGMDFIRNQVGFSGVMISDDLAMKALTGTQADLARETLNAGMDLALSCSGEFDDMRGIYECDILISKRAMDAHLQWLATRAIAKLSQDVLSESDPNKNKQSAL